MEAQILNHEVEKENLNPNLLGIVHTEKGTTSFLPASSIRIGRRARGLVVPRARGFQM